MKASALPTDRAYAYIHSRLFKSALAEIAATHKVTPAPVPADQR